MEEMGKYQQQQQQQLILLQQHVEALSKNGRRRSSVAIPNSVGAAAQAAAPTKKAHGVHMVLTLKATEEGVGSCKAAGWLGLSLLIILVQCVVLNVVIAESSHPRCNGHADCKSGEWCAPTPSLAQLNPGGCWDCYASTIRDPERGWDAVGDDEFWQEAAVHCELTDEMPLRCDHLVANRNMLSGGGVLVLVFSAVIALIPTVGDLDQATDEEEVMAARGVFSGGMSRLVRGLLFVSHRLRTCLVPVMVVGASAGLLLSNKFTSQSFLLNGMAVGFASNVDDMISFCVIREAERERVEEVVEELVRGGEGGGGEKGFRRNRLYGALLAATLVAAVVYCEELMPYIGDEGGGIGRAPCSDIANVAGALGGLPFRVVWMVLLVMAGFNERNTTWCARLSDALLGTLVLIFGYGVVSIFGIGLHFGVAA
ncbi:hypothetical protein TeGR_g12003 [Tetraparma gracilis]|uniref:Uncharacterized protein n=1 Tax=Tetraparma gracilis TaxID=2962635 RepID=A0ABQ6ME70_9STRA|nr:hypothetical protein TeGR_g12003 [Tetraparma gracilis]